MEGVDSRNIRDCIEHDPPKDDSYFPKILIQATIKAHLQAREAHFILCNSVDELEPETFAALNQKQNLLTYAIGPINFLATTSTPSNCLEWLSSKPPCSVLFVLLSGTAPVEKKVIQELAYGLGKSRANFLWFLSGDDGDVLPPGFEDEVAGRGMVVPWCDQREVLSNPAVGGFLTHCGWNAILESMWVGVPMICYPIYSDQPTNRNMVVYDWKIGINLCDKDQISREEVVEKIEKLMSSDNEVRMEMKKVKKIVHDALGHNGSSQGNMDKFLQDLKKKMCRLEN